LNHSVRGDRTNYHENQSMQDGENRKSRVPAPERVPENSPDLRAELLQRLRCATPEAFAEGRLDLEILKALLGDAVETRAERYEFNWAGKRDAIAMLQAPTRATLIPDPVASVVFDNAQHVFIEGENLEVLKVLYRSYFGQVKLIYIDPPYNTGNDFIYPDNFADPLDHYLRITGQKNLDGDYLTSQPERSGRFHSAWLTMMYPRLSIARQLLREDGFIFISCDDNEFHNLRHLMDFLFGEENFVTTIVVQSNKRGQTYKDVAKTHEFLMVYQRSDAARILPLPKQNGLLPLEDENGSFELWELRNRNPKFGRHNRPNLYYPFYVSESDTDALGNSKVSLERRGKFNIEVFPKNSEGKDSCWRWGKGKVLKSGLTGNNPTVVAKRRRDGGYNIYEKSRKSTTAPKSIWDSTDFINEQGTIELGELGLAGYFDHPKPLGLVDKIIRIATEDEDLVLDFFAGSGTTADATFRLNTEEEIGRRVIVVQLPEKIAPEHPAYGAGFRTLADLCRERLRRACGKSNGQGFRAFSLADSNIRRWTGIKEKSVESYSAQLEAFGDTLTPNWQPENVIWEVALREGFSLTARMEKLATPRGGTYWRVTDAAQARTFTICVDDKLSLDSVRELGLSKDDSFVCRDIALDDTLAANLALQCRLKVI
jgi:adenine-specific DNA-methyltransferase